ncbi:MAG: glucosaminidase domain-containing protein [Thermoplasmataceae archaeon]
MTPQEFITTYLSLATQAASDLHISPSFVLAQWALESSWGSSSAAVDGHNLAGIGDGGPITFTSLSEFLSEYVRVMKNDCPNLPNCTQASDAAEILLHTDYNPYPDYPGKVQAVWDTDIAPNLPAVTPPTSLVTVARLPLVIQGDGEYVSVRINGYVQLIKIVPGDTVLSGEEVIGLEIASYDEKISGWLVRAKIDFLDKGVTVFALNYQNYELGKTWTHSVLGHDVFTERGITVAREGSNLLLKQKG